MDMYSNYNVSFHNDTSIEHETGLEFITTPAVIAIVVSIIDGLLILFGATINIAIIITIVSHHRELKTMDLFILNLCLSDFVSSIFYQPLVITRLLARSAQSGIHTGVFKMASFTCLLADCAALFLVTFDKYLGIRFPFRYHTYFRKQNVVAIITCAWVIATAIGLTFALCDQAAKIAGILYGLLLLIMFIITPVLQVASFFVAKRHERRIQRMGKVVANCKCTRKPKPTDEIPSTDDISSEIAHSSINNSKPVHPFTSKAARTITLLTVVFITSWSPQIVLNVYFMITSDGKTFFRFIYLFVAFQQLHVCINPFIYVFRTQCIRNKFFGTRNEIGDCSVH
jgi:hypothetical protein